MTDVVRIGPLPHFDYHDTFPDVHHVVSELDYHVARVNRDGIPFPDSIKDVIFNTHGSRATKAQVADWRANNPGVFCQEGV